MLRPSLMASGDCSCDACWAVLPEYRVTDFTGPWGCCAHRGNLMYFVIYTDLQAQRPGTAKTLRAIDLLERSYLACNAISLHAFSSSYPSAYVGVEQGALPPEEHVFLRPC